MGFIILSLFGMNAIYRTVTDNHLNITPTSYTVIPSDDGATRELFALEGEYRIRDTMMFPFNRSSGKWANILNGAVIKNSGNIATNSSEYETCSVRTWGIRVEFFSMYPTIYSATCGSYSDAS